MTYEDFNELNIDQLMCMDGIGKTTAKRLVAMRPYRSNDDLFKVKGLGKTTLKRMGIEKSVKERKQWFNVDGTDYPMAAVARHKDTKKIDLFWRIPKEDREYLELDNKNDEQ